MRSQVNISFAVAFIAVLAAPNLTRADETRAPGIVTSSAVSATLSTKNMKPGGEMWALWLTLPPGARVQFPQGFSEWTDTELVLGGTSIGQGSPPAGTCFAFANGWRQDAANTEITSNPGDGFACSYGKGVAYWEENRGKELFVKAVVNIGGPPAPGDIYTGSVYSAAGGGIAWKGFDAKKFAPFEEELRAAGAMTVSIRQVTMPPGARIVTTDPYPVIRMITKGDMHWGTIPADADPATAPAKMIKGFEHTFIEWRAADQLVITNTTDKAEEFVEWSVVPAPGAMP